ncbi:MULTISPECIES: alpha/beta hydrolase family protein [unclassified Pseudomonas]|uniref:alpha/beta hydrolase family protein n=1 Tax=unclassified Pseudomonas TaxID=196821 RepID=UPI00244A7BC3|nr:MULTISPECIES: alpha/beta hydrolase family protein [unclassified Pseudomonas]MDG9926101.1 alpha/beta hydrolase family protein [Pseudomonas sp. GD04045]MDH0034157.1 alpha/beta hydrolase family protein [Pseudomonas sp. GD04019]
MRRPVLPTLLALCLTLALPVHAEEESPTPAETPAGEAPSEGAAPAEAPRQPLEERVEDNAEGLERQLPRDEQQTLQAGEEKFLALWKPANAPESKGVVILVPGADESADWPQAIKPLRLKLPDVEWSTLSLSLPDSKAAPLPEAVLPRAPEPVTVDTATAPAEGAAAAPASEGATTGAPGETAPPTETPAPAAAPVDPAERIFARIQAGIAFAEQQDAKHIVLLGHGDGAYWAALYLRERKPEQIKQLVVVAPQLPGGQTPALDELIPGLKLATGDFFYKDLPADRGSAVRRKQASKRLAHDGYTQIALKALPGNLDAEQEQLFRRVRGWLEKQ